MNAQLSRPRSEIAVCSTYAPNLYDRLFGRDEQAIEVGFWAHARRRFVKAELTDRARALIAIDFIKKLYEADRSTENLPPGQRTVERQARAGPVLDIFRQWLNREALVVLPKAPIAEAIGYPSCRSWPSIHGPVTSP